MSTVTFTCPTCHGKRQLQQICTKCGGTGELRVTTSGGSSTSYVPNQDGTLGYHLQTNFDPGVEIHTRDRCGGTRKIGPAYDCSTCRGQGQIVIVTSDLPQALCSECRGTGKHWETSDCPDCSGNGVQLITCSACGGEGHLTQEVGQCRVCQGTGKAFVTSPCSRCKASGTLVGPTCSTCGGKGKITQEAGPCGACYGTGRDFGGSLVSYLDKVRARQRAAH